MKARRYFLLCICFVVSAFQFTEKSLFFVPDTWPKPKYDFSKNPITESKVELGRKLFYDPIFSGDNTISCASCHSQYTAFTHVDHALSHGIEDRIGTRNSPALMNLAWQKLFMRDGAVNHLDMQALAPISNPLEMDETITHVVSKLQANNLYPTLFYRAFGDSIITGEHTLKAISQFMLTLISSNSRYDSVMRKQANFSEQEKNGYRLYQQNCSSCHPEPLFTNDEFMNNGLPTDSTLKDYGRLGVTKNPNDSLKFKVPTLRNVEFSYPYMHDGRFKRLSEVLKHYTSGIRQSNTLANVLQKPIVLTSNEKVDIIAFLLTLTDKSFLFNPKFSYPRK
ncbi:MAG: c-type cytochrome [Bacteroidetes bacterium]|nr:c-type cytochrome [Bacteroidota bacterium]